MGWVLKDNQYLDSGVSEGDLDLVGCCFGILRWNGLSSSARFLVLFLLLLMLLKFKLHLLAGTQVEFW